MADHAETILAEIKDALKIAEVVDEYFLDQNKWDRLIKDRPKRQPQHVKEAATDIGHDMLLEAGFFYDEEVAEFVNSLLTMFETGFLYGAAFQAEPENDPNYSEPTRHQFFDKLRLLVALKSAEKNR